MCEILLVSALLATFPSTMPTQSGPPSGKEINSLKRVVVALQAKSDDVFVLLRETRLCGKDQRRRSGTARAYQRWSVYFYSYLRKCRLSGEGRSQNT